MFHSHCKWILWICRILQLPLKQWRKWQILRAHISQLISVKYKWQFLFTRDVGRMKWDKYVEPLTIICPEEASTYIAPSPSSSFPIHREPQAFKCLAPSTPTISFPPTLPTTNQTPALLPFFLSLEHILFASAEGFCSSWKVLPPDLSSFKSKLKCHRIKEAFRNLTLIPPPSISSSITVPYFLYDTHFLEWPYWSKSYLFPLLTKTLSVLFLPSHSAPEIVPGTE